MTATPPLPDKTATVTITEIRDQHNNLVGDNTNTESLTLTAKGTAAPNTPLWLRDRVSQITDVTSGPGGIWTKTFTLTQFKCVVFSAIEKDLPYDYSPSKRFTTITTTPITNTVTGDGAPIENGGNYDGASVEFIGNAPPRATLKVFDGTIELSETATVDACGLFKFTLSGLEEKTYEIKFQAPDGKESLVFTFTKGTTAEEARITTITDEEKNPIPPGTVTHKRFLIIHCTGEKGKEIEAFDGLISLGKEVVGDEGTCEIRTPRLPDKDYKVTVKGLYPGGGESDPYPLEVDGIKSIDGVRDDDGNSVPEGENTIENNLTVSGTAEAGATVTLSGGVPTPVEFDADENGDWTYRFAGLTPNTYSLTADSEGIRLAPTEPRTFTVEAAAVVTLDNVTDAADNVIPEDGKTLQKLLFVNCTGEKGKEIQVLDGTTPLGKELVKPDGTCKIPIGPLEDKTYKVKGEGLYPGGGESSTYSFTVEKAEQYKITNVVGENNQKIEDGDETTSKYFVFWGEAPANTQMKLNGSHVTPEPTDKANGKGVCVFFISQTPPGKYTVNIQKSSGPTPTSPDFSFEVLP